jgi:hypothetical protein
VTVTAEGLDGSHFQTLSNPASVAAAVRFAWWKATEGASLADATFASAVSRLKAAGVVCGAYHYAHSGSATGQAAFFKQHAATVLGHGSLRPMLDMEDASLQAALAVAHMHEQDDLPKAGPSDTPLAQLARALHTTRDLAASLSNELWASATSEKRAAWKRAAAELRPAALIPIGQVDELYDLAEATLQSANGFVRDFYDSVGVPGMVVYGNLTWWNTVFKPATWGDRDMLGMIARYNGDPGNPGFTYAGMAVHQWTSTGSVPGISTVDRDAIFNGHSLADLTLGSSEDDMGLTDEEHGWLFGVWQALFTGSHDSAGQYDPIVHTLADEQAIETETQRRVTNAATDTASIKASVAALPAAVAAATQAVDADVKASIAAAVKGLQTGAVDPAAFAAAVAPLVAAADLAAFREQFNK